MYCGPPGRAGQAGQCPRAWSQGGRGARAPCSRPPPRPPPAPARATLTLSRSRGCVQQAAPHEARPPKYQRDTRASAAMPGGAPAARALSGLDPDPDPDSSPRRHPGTGFKAPSATRARRNQCARALRGVSRSGAGSTPGAGPTRPRPQSLKGAAVSQTGSGAREHTVLRPPFPGTRLQGTCCAGLHQGSQKLASLPTRGPRATPRLGHMVEGRGRSLGLCQGPHSAYRKPVSAGTPNPSRGPEPASSAHPATQGRGPSRSAARRAVARSSRGPGPPDMPRLWV